MKKYLPLLTSKVHLWNLFLGLVIGSAVATFYVSAIAPDADEVAKMCRMDAESQKEDKEKRYDQIIESMNTVTDQKTYLGTLISHHELEISMSRRMLELDPTADVQAVARQTIETNTEEIRRLKALLSELNN